MKNSLLTAIVPCFNEEESMLNFSMMNLLKARAISMDTV